jgi:hypothetical protein
LVLRERTSCTNWVRTESRPSHVREQATPRSARELGGQARSRAHRRLRRRKYGGDSSRDFHRVIA